MKLEKVLCGGKHMNCAAFVTLRVWDGRTRHAWFSWLEETHPRLPSFLQLISLIYSFYLIINKILINKGHCKPPIMSLGKGLWGETSYF